jgi:hypothetical protein
MERCALQLASLAAMSGALKTLQISSCGMRRV